MSFPKKKLGEVKREKREREDKHVFHRDCEGGGGGEQGECVCVLVALFGVKVEERDVFET